MPLRPLLTTVAIGLAAGLGSGLLGVGGGIIMVPLLTALAGLSQHQAHATSLAAIIPIAFVGMLAFAAESEVDFGIAAHIALGSLIGVPLGAAIMARVREGLLMTLFGGLMIAVAMRMLVA
jgi:uncharacterized membrane protein YfcA